MNPANIQMLAQLLQRAAEALGSEHDAGRYDLSPLRLSEDLRHRLAEQMVSDGGVLAPAALTDAQAAYIGADAARYDTGDRTEVGLRVRQNLKRIAKGEE